MFTYPNHFTYPEDSRIFFLDHVENWDRFLMNLEDKPNVCLEIGALHGGASVFMLEKYCKLDGSHLYVIDINEDPYLKSNLSPYQQSTFLCGQSEDICRNLTHNGERKEFLDLVYIDGNHMAKYVLEDAVNSFYMLKDGGFMIFDDYGWGKEGPEFRRPDLGINSFCYAYQKHIDVLFVNWQVIIRKKQYTLDIKDINANYITVK